VTTELQCPRIHALTAAATTHNHQQQHNTHRPPTQPQERADLHRLHSSSKVQNPPKTTSTSTSDTTTEQCSDFHSQRHPTTPCQYQYNCNCILQLPLQDQTFNTQHTSHLHSTPAIHTKSLTTTGHNGTLHSPCLHNATSQHGLRVNNSTLTVCLTATATGQNHSTTIKHTLSALQRQIRRTRRRRRHSGTPDLQYTRLHHQQQLLPQHTITNSNTTHIDHTHSPKTELTFNGPSYHFQIHQRRR
jgi:ribosome-associated translation inhibitor RaiA